jgi:hypothetical protein
MRLSASRLVTTVLMACTAAVAQTAPSETPVLEFTGAPLKLPYTCTDEDLQWAGLSCVDESCPVYVELDHAAGYGKTILITGDFHAPSATLFSLLLRTTDGGRTWQEPFSRVRGASLEHVQMYDATTAWISGQTLQPIALDPFFLLTTDGGKTWEKLTLFEEGTPGTILQFAFDSRDHGKALIDHGGGAMRYEIYETETGGRTWTTIQNSGKLPKFEAPADLDWRVNPEPKLFRLEHREEGRWSPFASFAVAAAVCHAQPEQERSEPKPIEPPPQ